MENFLSTPEYVTITPYRMVSARVISTNPEDEVIGLLVNWVREKGLDPASCRCFGFDVPVPEAEQKQGIRGYEYWISVPENIIPSGEIGLVDFGGGKFIKLRIADPFADPFDRIPKGWQALVKHIRENGIPVEWCAAGSCLEEVVQADGQTCMDVLIRMK